MRNDVQEMENTYEKLKSALYFICGLWCLAGKDLRCANVYAIAVNACEFANTITANPGT